MRPARRFGEPPAAERRYVERPGAYAVIVDGDKVLVVEWQGQLYLPGGGLDPGEGTLAALHRECLEETGWRIRVERRLGAFQRYLYARDLNLWLHKLCHVYLARPALRMGRPTQPGHRPVWMPLKTAVTDLAGAGERALVRRLDPLPSRVVRQHPAPPSCS